MENATDFPNPDVYLNYMSPDQGMEFEVARDFYLTILGAAIWDLLAYIPGDIHIVLKGINVVAFCFIFSRVCAIGYALMFTVIQTHPLANCEASSIITHIFCIISMSCTSFLFLRRLHAVYAEIRIVRWIFTLLWMGVTACAFPIFVGMHIGHAPGTDFCTFYKVASYISIIDFFPAAFDTLVFFAISYRVITTHGVFDEGVSWGDVITGKVLPRLPRALFNGGQQYYLIVFGVTFVAGAILYAPSIPPTFRPLMTLASTTLTASMACRVFRNLKTLEADHQMSFLPTTTPIQFIHPEGTEDK